MVANVDLLQSNLYILFGYFVVAFRSLILSLFSLLNNQGLKFSDLMYVTKRSMANAVSNLTKHLEQVTEALSVSLTTLTLIASLN